MSLVNFWVLIKMSLEWSLKPGFGIQKKCSFPQNREVPSLEETNKKVLYVNTFLGLPKFSLQYGGVPRGSIVIDIRLNSNKSYNNYRLQFFYYKAYLNRSLMHPHCVHSYAHPMDGVDNSQWNSHFPDTEHRPAKSFHFLDQTVHCVEH